MRVEEDVVNAIGSLMRHVIVRKRFVVVNAVVA